MSTPSSYAKESIFQATSRTDPTLEPDSLSALPKLRRRQIEVTESELSSTLWAGNRSTITYGFDSDKESVQVASVFQHIPRESYLPPLTNVTVEDEFHADAPEEEIAATLLDVHRNVFRKSIRDSPEQEAIMGEECRRMASRFKRRRQIQLEEKQNATQEQQSDSQEQPMKPDTVGGHNV
jgi:hypothetical protein